MKNRIFIVRRDRLKGDDAIKDSKSTECESVNEDFWILVIFSCTINIINSEIFLHPRSMDLKISNSSAVTDLIML